MGKYWDRMNGVEPVVDQVPQQQSGGGKYWNKLNGVEEQPAQAQAQQPEGRGFFGTIKDMVVGKQDPNYEGTGTVYDQFTDSAAKDLTFQKSKHGEQDLRSPTATAAMMGASDPQMADVIQKQLGDKFIRREQDANGYDVFVTRGEDGQEQKGYINKPGLDMQDLWRGAYGAAPYAVTGGAAYGVTGAMPIAAQVAGQSVTAGATSLAGDVALQGQGSEQGLEFGKAAFTAAGGAAGPVVGHYLNKFNAGRTAASMIDDSSGGLSAGGADVAAKAGINPADLDAEAAKIFANTYAMSGDKAEAAIKSAARPFGIPVSRGQATKKPDLLTQEEGMRRNLYGESAQNTIDTFDKRQAEAIKDAALGPRIAGQIAPHRAPSESSFDANPATLGSSIRQGLESAQQGAKEGAKKAWGDVPQMKATSEALEMLPQVVQKKLDGIVIDENTPQALKMDGAMGAFMRGETPQASTQVAKNAPIHDVDRMRRRLLDMSRAQTTPEDERAAGAMYDAFNDWIDEAAAKNLISGDSDVAAKLKVARGFTREVKQLFEPRDARGRLSSGGQRLAKMLDAKRADSPEALIDSLMGSQGSKSVTSGTVDALNSVRQMLSQHADPEVGKNAWNDIRLAYWVRTVQGKNGELLGPQAMLTNLKSAFSSQRSVVNAMYSPQEQATMFRLQKALEAIAYKPPNASGSGYTAAQYIKEGVGKIAEAFGLKSVIGKTLLSYTGVVNRYGKALADGAIDQGTKMKPNYSPSMPVFSGASGAYGRAQEDRKN